MSTEDNKVLMRRYLEAALASDQTAFQALLAPDFVAHVNGQQDRATFLQHNRIFVEAFSDRRFTVEDLVAEGDRVVARTTWRGVHTRTFQDLPPTGKQIVISAVLIERIKDGQMVEHWSLFDNLSMMQQLGIVPSPQASQ
jgi:steroid delta-isomerase-like uncharacterized protein